MVCSRDSCSSIAISSFDVKLAILFSSLSKLFFFSMVEFIVAIHRSEAKKEDRMSYTVFFNHLLLMGVHNSV